VHGVQYGHCDFLHGHAGHVEEGELQGCKNGFGADDLGPALGEGGISAARQAACADLLEALRIDRQPAELLAVWNQYGWRFAVYRLQVLLRQRIIGSVHAVMEGKIKANRSLACTGNAEQDDIGLIVFLGRDAVIAS